MAVPIAEVQRYKSLLDDCRKTLLIKDDQVDLLTNELARTDNRRLELETENESLKRRLERCISVNDDLLTQLQSFSESVLIHEDAEKALNEEIHFLKGRVTDSVLIRRNVIGQLKDVSVETKDLIKTCEIAFKEVDEFKTRAEEMETKAESYKKLNSSLIAENSALKVKLEDRLPEISTSGSSPSCFTDEVLNANMQLRDLEILSQKLISWKTNCEGKIKRLQIENDALKSELFLRNKTLEDQSCDYRKMMLTVAQYEADVSRMDNELKGCHQRISGLVDHLNQFNFDNVDLIEYINFKKAAVSRFGSKENIESLLSKLQVLREIECFFQSNFASMEEKSNGVLESASGNVGRDNERCTISQIKGYLERAWSLIEELNNKMHRMQNNFENRLSLSINEIATLRQVLSNTSLYNGILEEILQHYRNNDVTINVEIKDLLSVHESLMDGFENLKHLYTLSFTSNNFLLAKLQQSKLFFKIVKAYVERLEKCHGLSQSNQLLLKLKGTVALFFDIHDEIVKTDPTSQTMAACQEIMHRSLISRQRVKSSVQYMSAEVKKLTVKIEKEIVEKMREIEMLRTEVEKVKVDNLDLVNKIKNCNSEIIQLSTENYNLNERLEICNEGVKNEKQLLREELEQYKNNTLRNSALTDRLSFIHSTICHLKLENSSLKNDVVSCREAHKKMLSELLSVFLENQRKVIKGLGWLSSQCTTLHSDRTRLKLLVTELYGDLVKDFDVINKAVIFENVLVINSLKNMKITCLSIRDENRIVKREMESFIEFFSKQMLPILYSELEKSCRSVHENRNRNLRTDMLKANKLEEIVRVLRQDLTSLKEQIPSQFENAKCEIQELMVIRLEEMKSSFANNSDEVIKEMQEMNLELKKRGESISELSQLSDELRKRNQSLLDELKAKESEFNDLLSRKLYEQEKTNNSQILEVSQTTLESQQTAKKYFNEMNKQQKRIEYISLELENANNLIQSKDNIINGLRSELLKQKEIQDGDMSSVGTISKSEEISRLKDVEDSFEERYMKLKVLAIQMKKKIAQLEQQMKIDQSDKATLQNKILLLTEQAKHTQLLQSECDKLTDDMELKVNEIKGLKKIILDSDKNCNELKEEVSRLKGLLKHGEEKISLCLKENSELEFKVRVVTAELDNLKKEKTADEILRKENEKYMLQVKQKLKDSEDKQQKLKQDFEEMKEGHLKKESLVLKMKDYEILITNLNESISKYEETLESKEILLKHAITQLESEKSKNENLLLQLSSTITEMKSSSNSFESTKTDLDNQVKTFNTKLITMENELKKKENEYIDLKNDYDSYKIRVHCVLQKLKSENNSINNEKKWKDEIALLGQTIKNLKMQIDDSLIDVDYHKTQLQVVESSKENLQRRVKELSDEVQSKTNEIDSMQSEYRVYRLNSDTHLNDLKAEISKLKSELVELQSKQFLCKTSKSKNSEAALPEVLHIDKTHEPECYSETGTMCNLSHGFHDSLESMDEAKTYGKKRKQSLVPLDKLLESSNVEDLEISQRNAAELNDRVKSLSEQVSYLTNMLNESEKNAARNEQQVSLLKEEIRRLQRVFEREPHLKNNEYLKNVMLKFVSLPLGDEKSRLVNVLDTILKLSPNERELLQAISKGDHSDYKQSGSWTSYLGWS